MATIAQDLEKIRQATYGEEVREAIADGLEHCYHIHDVDDEKTYIQNAINEFELRKNQVSAAMAAMAQLGTDTTLTTSGVAADAKETGDRIKTIKEAVGTVKSFDRGNLFKRSNVEKGKYIKNDGSIGSSSSLFYTDYILVDAGRKYVWNTAPQSSPGGFYDLSKNWKKNISVESYGSNLSSFTPNESGYVRINAQVSFLKSLYFCVAGEEQYGAFIAAPYDQVIKNKQSLIEIFEPYNLYNKNAPTTDNSLLLNSGAIIESSGYFVTDYIEVPMGGTYTISYTLSSPGCTFDKDKNLIRNIFDSDATYNSPKTFTLFEDEKYVRLNVRNEHRESFVFVRGTCLSVNKNGQKLITGMFVNSNLYSQEGTETGKLLLNDGTTTDNANYAISGYIDIPGVGYYTIPYTFSSPGCVYDANKNVIGKAYDYTTDNHVYSFRIDNENARYIRLNIRISDIETFRLCKGFELSNAPYGAKMIDGLKIYANDVIGSMAGTRWMNKHIVCFGDSRTWYDGKNYTSSTKTEWTGKACKGYQQIIAEHTNAILVNQGVSGDTSTQICDRIRSYDFTQASAVLFEGGVNDFVKSSQVVVGQIAPIGSAFDTETIYGAWQSAIEYVLTNYPQVKIFMDIPAIAWISDNVFPYSIAKIKGEIAELYNIPCCDLYKNGGISECNRDYYYADDVSNTGWRLHFNDYGNALIGDILAAFINTH